MNLGVGIDTGGTYTDSVVLDLDSNRVLDSAKALTTREDLTIGITNSISKLNPEYFSHIRLVSISTTLATNSVVEGKGCRVGLIVVGHETYADLPVDASIEVKGGHKLTGEQKEELDIAKARVFVEEAKGKVDAFAVSSYLSIRNPEHELTLKKMIKEMTAQPVACGHELSTELGFYERTVTAVLNAKLIPIIQELINSVREGLLEKKISAPIMIVRGDGSLMGEQVARERPIETILSGPAASVMGAKFLTEEDNAVVVDVGGTTTDIAILRNGKPHLDAEGATVGGWKTRVKAIDMLTAGVGGDSRIIVEDNKIILSPRRIIPLCIAASSQPILIEKLRAAKNKQTIYPPYSDKRKRLIQTTDFFILTKKIENLEIGEKEKKLLELLKSGPHSLYEAYDILRVHPYMFNIDRLEELNVLYQIGVTPTDVLHAEGSYVEYNADASKIGVEIFARRMGVDVDSFIQEVKKAVVEKIALQILTKLVQEQIKNSNIPGCEICRYFFDNMLRGAGTEDMDLRAVLNKKIIGIGAPVGTYLPKVAEKFNTPLLIPSYAGVGNAVGAISGSIIESMEATIKPAFGFADVENPPCIIHSPLEKKEFDMLSEAVEYVINHYGDEVKRRAISSGAEDVEIKIERKDKIGPVREGYGKGIFLETRLTISAIGKPRLSFRG